MTDPTGLAWRRLGCAILLRAWRDAHCTNGAKAAREAGLAPGVCLADDARVFLVSDGASWLLELLELPPALAEEIRGGLPPLKWMQLELGL